MGIARSTCYSEAKGSADDTALVEAMHAIKDAVAGPRVCKCRHRLRCARNLVLRRKTVSQVHRVGSVAHPDAPVLAMSMGLDSGTGVCRQV